MNRTIIYSIGPSEEGLTVLQFLKTKGYSSSNIIDLKKTENSILADDVWVHVNYVLKRGETLKIHYCEQTSSQNILPQKLSLSIVYEDEDILVVNKPKNMPIHPSLNHYTGTLANAVMHYYLSKGENYTFRCVNRLDKDTTGLVLLAKHGISSGILSVEMQQRNIHRTYLALVEGIFEEKQGTIHAPIARKGASIIEREVNFENGEDAITHYEVLQTSRNRKYSLLSLHLETGRTHQIRVHMQHIGHPLIGDTLYPSDCSSIDRQALHSYRLTFTHPITGEKMDFKADLPNDMSRLL